MYVPRQSARARSTVTSVTNLQDVRSYNGNDNVHLPLRICDGHIRMVVHKHFYIETRLHCTGVLLEFFCIDST